MSVGAIGLIYLALGGVLATAVALAGRLAARSDLVLLVALWPIWLPLALAKPAPRDPAVARAHTLVELRRLRAQYRAEIDHVDDLIAQLDADHDPPPLR